MVRCSLDEYKRTMEVIYACDSLLYVLLHIDTYQRLWGSLLEFYQYSLFESNLLQVYQNFRMLLNLISLVVSLSVFSLQDKIMRTALSFNFIKTISCVLFYFFMHQQSHSVIQPSLTCCFITQVYKISSDHKSVKSSQVCLVHSCYLQMSLQV